MNTRFLILLLLLVPAEAIAQNFPDRLVVYDPLANHSPDTTDFDWLVAERIHNEFGRYSNGSDNAHRWNAKLGGWIDLARWDSTWSIALVGTTEIVIDPNNSISSIRQAAVLRSSCEVNGSAMRRSFRLRSRHRWCCSG